MGCPDWLNSLLCLLNLHNYDMVFEDITLDTPIEKTLDYKIQCSRCKKVKYESNFR